MTLPVVFAITAVVNFINELLFFLATMDVKKNIYSLCINKYDTQIALVENQGIFESGQESVVRIYDVGRRRDNEDDQVSVFDWLSRINSPHGLFFY